LSNNGFSVYQHLADVTRNDADLAQKFDIRGLILDSAPGPLSWPSFMACRSRSG
jgi:hypothetical protein